MADNDKIEILPPDKYEKLAEVLFNKMNRLDPFTDDEWKDLPDFDREFYIASVKAVIEEYEQWP